MWHWLSGFQDRSKDYSFLYQAIYAQLEQAILAGTLKAGDKLPPQRQLANKLGTAVATVTRVYKMATEQGLVSAKVGKGSFVSSMPILREAISAQSNQCINLSIIKPQVSLAESVLKQQLKNLSEQNNLAQMMDYNPDGGSITDQQAAKEWLGQQGVNLKGRAISICSGAQHGLTVLINSLTQHTDYIAVESLCYPGIISAVNQLGRKLVAVEMNDEGMCPDSLDKICQQYAIKMLVVVASHQNPTSVVMSIQRRRQIAKIVNKHSIYLVDDDVYGFLSPDLPKISNFSPDQSFYLTSFSKSILPGLRVGYVVCPERFKQQINAEVRNSIWMPVPLTLALTSRLIYSGDANLIQIQQRNLAEKRQRLACRILQNCEYKAQHNGYHIWLILPQQWSSESFSIEVKKRGVLVTSADYFCAEKHQHIAAIRISLMSAKSSQELSFALTIIAKLISQST